MAKQAKDRGYNKLSIRVLWDVLRWERMLNPSDPNQDDYKFNDHYTSYYSRLIMHNVGSLNGLFEVRYKNRRA